MTGPKVLLFDLGGVIVPWIGMIELSRLTGRTEADLIKTASTSDTFTAYEIGGCTTEEFLGELNSICDLNMERDELGRLWNEWVRPPYEGTRQSLLKLKSQHTLACLSNTNESHWDYLKATHNILDVFHNAYASHLLKAAKPDSKAWQLCLDDMDVKAQDVWFFDDTLANIDAAMDMGIQSFQVDRNVGVLPRLKDLGVFV